MGLFRKMGDVVSKTVLKPVEKLVFRPVKDRVKDHVIDPVADYVVNPVREKVDHDFAIRDELQAYETAAGAFQLAYAEYAENWSRYVTARITYEKLSEEFSDVPKSQSGPSYRGPIALPTDENKRAFLDFFRPDSLGDLVTGKKFTRYFDRIEDNQAFLRVEAKNIQAATRQTRKEAQRLERERAALEEKSQHLRAQFGAGGGVSAHLLAQIKTTAQADLVRQMQAQGYEAQTIAAVTGWSLEFVQNALTAVATDQRAEHA